LTNRTCHKYTEQLKIRNSMEEDEKSEHKATFHRCKLTEKKIQSTVMYADGKLTVPPVQGIAKMPGQSRMSE